MEWLQLFITYQNTWGSDMMAPDGAGGSAD